MTTRDDQSRWPLIKWANGFVLAPNDWLADKLMSLRRVFRILKDAFRKLYADEETWRLETSRLGRADSHRLNLGAADDHSTTFEV